MSPATVRTACARMTRMATVTLRATISALGTMTTLQPTNADAADPVPVPLPTQAPRKGVR
jgi:hypothetical protein